MGDDPDKVISISVETSGRTGSVAVGRGPAVLACASFRTQDGHGVELLPTVDRLCRRVHSAPREIEQVYVSGGPGSFTGLRIGVTFAKAMAFAIGSRTVRVPTLEVVAQNALEINPSPPRVVVVLDAKRGHLYAAAFELSGEVYTPLDAPEERDPRTYLPSLGTVTALGEGLIRHAAAVAAAGNVSVAAEWLNCPRAEVVHLLGRRMAAENRFTPINELVPIYIRRPEAEEKWEERHSKAGRNPR